MFKVNLIAVGALKEPYEKAACAEYEKRLKAFCTLTVTELPAANVRGEHPADIARALKEESVRILPKCAGTTAVLDPAGDMLHSEAFAAYIQKIKSAGGELTFVIGGSHGLGPDVKARAVKKISFSPMTFPHKLFRVMFLEQLYRAFTIIEGKEYHK